MLQKWVFRGGGGKREFGKVTKSSTGRKVKRHKKAMAKTGCWGRWNWRGEIETAILGRNEM